jgi:hypothetical protein
MSDRRNSARKMLGKLAAEIGAWPERKNNEVFKRALIDIAADEAAAAIVAQLGDKIPLMPYFVANAQRDAIEEAVGRMMHTTAYAMADPFCRPVSAKEIIEKREEFERAQSQAAAVPLAISGAYRFGVGLFQTIQAPLTDPIVERRPPTRKKPDVSLEDYEHARAVRARVMGEGRRLFGKVGDRVTDVFVTAATGVLFSKDDQRVHLNRKRLRRLGLSDGRPVGRQTDPE